MILTATLPPGYRPRTQELISPYGFVCIQRQFGQCKSFGLFESLRCRLLNVTAIAARILFVYGLLHHVEVSPRLIGRVIKRSQHLEIAVLCGLQWRYVCAVKVCLRREESEKLEACLGQLRTQAAASNGANRFWSPFQLLEPLEPLQPLEPVLQYFQQCIRWCRVPLVSLHELQIHRKSRVLLLYSYH